MMEIIESVNKNYSEKGYSGVLIKTNKQEIKLLIADYQSCCEDWGYIVTEDNETDFIGAEVRSITLTDSNLRTEELSEYENDSQCCMVFCSVNTSEGTLQFTAYNSHNGYYSHEVRIISNQLTEEDYV